MNSPRSDSSGAGDGLSGDGAARELVRLDEPGGLSAADAVAHHLAQSNREAAANRAQARELIRALEGVQRSQEYLGTALRDERAKSRWLFVLLVLVPVVVAAGVWFVARRVDEARSVTDERITQLAATSAAARADDTASLRNARVTELARDLDGLRHDLGASRDDLTAERKLVIEREAALAAAQSRSEGARVERETLEFEVRTAKSTVAAGEARAAILEKRIEELQASHDAAAKAAAPRVVPEPAPTSAAAAKTLSDPVATEKVRTVLNALLKGSDDTVRYEFESVGGLAGPSLTDVRLAGTDEQGRSVRTIQAARVEIAVDAASSSVVLRFFEGKVIIGTIQAPFFDGSYGLVVRGDAARWKASGLDCVR